MKLLACALLFSAVVCAQQAPVNFYIDPSAGHDSTDQLTSLPATYQFPDTAVGDSSAVVLRVVNPSTTASVVLNAVFVGAAANSATATPDFTITGLAVNATLAPGSSKLFTLSFTPSAAGSLSGYLQTQVDGSLYPVSTLQGMGDAAAQLTLTCDGTVIGATAAIDFGSLSTAQPPLTKSCSVQNTTAAGVDVSFSTEQFNSSAFSVNGLPLTVAAGDTGNFSITFAPGSANNFVATLTVGSSVHTVQGIGTSSTVGDVSSLTVSYFSPVCECSTPANPATPIAFGQVVTGNSGTLTITVQNPSTTIYAVSVPTLTVTGAGFALSGAPTLPVSIQPGQSISFTITFAAGTVGTTSGMLTIGGRPFPIQGQSIEPLVSDATFQVDVSPLVSQKQAHLTITVGSAPAGDLIGTLTMQFASSVANVTDDPAINFVATSGRQLNVTVAGGSQTAAYSGQAAITFQTGSTAGTITFTLQFPNSPAITKSFTIAPQDVQVTAMTAVRQDPNLVVTITGYDNTYSLGSAGNLDFLFATALGAKDVSADASAAFHSYFFGTDTAGGAFVLTATFPVSGDVTQVSSVTATLKNNQSGATTVTQAFQ